MQAFGKGQQKPAKIFRCRAVFWIIRMYDGKLIFAGLRGWGNPECDGRAVRFKASSVPHVHSEKGLDGLAASHESINSAKLSASHCVALRFKKAWG